MPTILYLNSDWRPCASQCFLTDLSTTNTDIFQLPADFCLATHYRTSPKHLSDDQVRDYLRPLLVEKKVAHSSCKAYLAGITYFCRHICSREVDDRFGLSPRPRGRMLPAVLSVETHA